MSTKENFKISWYRQETEGAPYFIYQACRGCLNWFRDVDNVIWCCYPDYARAYLSKEKFRQLAERYLNNERKSFGSFGRLFVGWNKKVLDANEKIFFTIDKLDLSKISDNKLLDFNRRLSRQTFIMWSQIFIDIYDIDAESLVKKEIVNAGVRLTEKEINTLMTQGRLLTHQRAEKDLLKIAKMVKNDLNAVNIFSYISASENLHRLNFVPKIAKAIKQYQSDYFWMYNSWAHCQNLSLFEVVDSVKQILSGPRIVEKELLGLANFEKNIKRGKEDILRKCKASKWVRQVFIFFEVLAFWRDERKRQMQRLNYYLEKVGREIGRRSELGWEEVRKCDPLTIKILPLKIKAIKEAARFLKTRPIMRWDGKKVVHLSAKEGGKIERRLENSINSAVSEIRGMIACPGKVEGEVVVINKMSEFNKMKPGKILVTVMTRPEFVPLMKKAAGIITDEGGITSHAAVISRELKVPCVIGTQAATKKLKDGDKVFLNADHGIVILK